MEDSQADDDEMLQMREADVQSDDCVSEMRSSVLRDVSRRGEAQEGPGMTPGEMAACMGMDAMRIALGGHPKNFTVEEVIHWLRLVSKISNGAIHQSPLDKKAVGKRVKEG